MKPIYIYIYIYQARRHVFESGPAEDRASAEGTRGGEYDSGCPSRKWGSGDLPRENFDLCMPLSAFFFINFGCVLGQNFSRFS